MINGKYSAFRARGSKTGHDRPEAVCVVATRFATRLSVHESKGFFSLFSCWTARHDLFSCCSLQRLLITAPWTQSPFNPPPESIQKIARLHGL